MRCCYSEFQEIKLKHQHQILKPAALRVPIKEKSRKVHGVVTKVTL
jgi:hypothetical protein